MREGCKLVSKPYRVTGDRKLDRNVARYRMRQRGITQMNKPKMGETNSYFANNWRDYVY